VIDEILRQKRTEVAGLNEGLLRNVRPSTRNLSYTLGNGRENFAVFVELKRRDPYTGDMPADLDLFAFAETVQSAGAAGFVVVTEGLYWGGSRDDLVELDRRGVQLPLIRNDFVIEELQLYESRRAGADSVFLRAGLMDDARMRSALRVVASMHMVGIIMVHDAAELERALATDVPVIAISNRDAASGTPDLERTLDLASRVPASRSLLACFGIAGVADVQRLRGRVDGVCVGTALLRAPDPAAFLVELSAR
jgi:indole-3-glycerol phosphate synthase